MRLIFRINRAAVINDSSPTTDTESAVQFLSQQLNGIRPHTAVILGSGLGAVGRIAVEAGGRAIDYANVPGMPQTAVVGHAGRIVIGQGRFEGVLFLQGRVHYYEGHSLNAITFATRVAAALGVQNLIVSNAAGGIRREFQPGDLMLIDGHWTFLNVQSASDLRRFTLEHARLWNADLRRLATEIPTPLNVHSGVYAMMSGPNYETPAEVRMLASMGVSAVGMSTVPEAITAARLGLRVIGVSCITNVASGLSDAPLDHSEVSATAGSIESEFTAWMCELLLQLRLKSF